MYKPFTTLILWWNLTMPCYGEITVDWTNVPLAKQPEIEERVKRAANAFADKQYADLGTHDFVTSKEKHKVIFESNPHIGTYCTQDYTITIDPRVLKNMNLLETIIVHEFSHGYDDIKTDMLLCGPMRHHGKTVTRVRRIMLTSEERAQAKERRYLGHMRLSSKEAEKMNNFYNQIDALMQQKKEYGALLLRQGQKNNAPYSDYLKKEEEWITQINRLIDDLE